MHVLKEEREAILDDNQIVTSMQSREPFSLKQGYVNHIIASIATQQKVIYRKLIPSQSNTQVSEPKNIYGKLIVTKNNSLGVSEPKGIYGKLIPSVNIAKSKTLNEIVLSKFKLIMARM